jgi:hypothetical protein
MAGTENQVLDATKDTEPHGRRDLFGYPYQKPPFARVLLTTKLLRLLRAHRIRVESDGAIALYGTNRPSEWQSRRECAKSGACSGGDAFVAMVKSANLRDIFFPIGPSFFFSGHTHPFARRRCSTGRMVTVVGL